MPKIKGAAGPSVNRDLTGAQAADPEINCQAQSEQGRAGRRAGEGPFLKGIALAVTGHFAES
jgi:hypothetical protein